MFMLDLVDWLDEFWSNFLSKVLHRIKHASIVLETVIALPITSAISSCLLLGAITAFTTVKFGYRGHIIFDVFQDQGGIDPSSGLRVLVAFRYDLKA